MLSLDVLPKSIDFKQETAAPHTVVQPENSNINNKASKIFHGIFTVEPLSNGSTMINFDGLTGTLTYQDLLASDQEIASNFSSHRIENRDKVTTVVLECTYLTNLKFLSLFPNLKELTFTGCSRLEKLDGLEGNTSLRALQINSSGIKSLQGIKNSKIEDLSIDSCQMLDSISGVPVTLTQLRFQTCPSILTLNPLDKLVNLVKLNLGNLRQANLRINKPIHLPKLEVLDLSRSNIAPGSFTSAKSVTVIKK